MTLFSLKVNFFSSGTTVEKDVENLLKLNSKKNCFELATAGFTRSGFHFVDPDGDANKNPPIRSMLTLQKLAVLQYYCWGDWNKA